MSSLPVKMKVWTIIAKNSWKTEITLYLLCAISNECRVSLRYFVSYCSLFLVYVFKVFRKTPSSFLLRNKMWNILLALFISKACTFSSSERFFC